MKDIDSRGLFAGLIVWVIAVYGMSQQMACNRTACGSDDMLMMGIIAAGMLAPAWVVATLLSKPEGE